MDSAIPEEDEQEDAEMGEMQSSASQSSKDRSPSLKSPISPSSDVPFGGQASISRESSRGNLHLKGTRADKWAKLPESIRFYINYHHQHITHQHYSMKHDPGDFLKTYFLEMALDYEPLLYAVVAFSAYHHTLTAPNGKIQHFLGYYSKSVQSLRRSLEKSPRHTEATLLTILQLATFEVSRSRLKHAT